MEIFLFIPHLIRMVNIFNENAYHGNQNYD